MSEIQTSEGRPIALDLEGVIRSEGPRVRHLARHLLGAGADVDDAVQDAWQAVHVALPGFRGESRLGTWALRVARSALIDFGRRRARRRRHEQPAERNLFQSASLASLRDEPFRACRRIERIARVRAGLDALPAIYREVLTLRSFGGLRYAEIAAELELPIGTVRSRIAAGSALLAKTLCDEAGENP